MSAGRIPSIEGGIQPTLLDAKADLITATANDTPARIGVGANDTVLTADSSTATGLKWAAPAGGGGGMTSIASGTLSGATVSLTSIPGTYNDLVLRLFAVNITTDDKSVRVRLNSASGATDYVLGFAVSGSMTSAGGNPEWVVTGGTDDAVLSNYIELKLPSYADTSTFQYVDILSFFANPVTTTTLDFRNHLIGVYRANTAITSIQILMLEGVEFDGGTYVLYGVK